MRSNSQMKYSGTIFLQQQTHAAIEHVSNAAKDLDLEK